MGWSVHPWSGPGTQFCDRWRCRALGLVAQTAPGREGEHHGEYRDDRRDEQVGVETGDELGHHLLAADHVEGAVEESHEENAASRNVVEPHDEDPEEDGEHRKNAHLDQGGG